MARFNLYSSIKRAVTNLLRLASKAAAPAPAPKVKRPKPPEVTPPAPAPVPPTDYEKVIEELRQKIEAQNKQIEELKAQLKEPSFKAQLNEDDLPYEIKDDIPSQEFNFSEDDLPYEVVEEEPTETPETPAEYENVYKNFGSEESLDVLINFLGDTNLSGISPNSAFFDMDPLQQKMLLLDYVEFQHDANPSLFYKGRKALSLENVPIWGSEFDRYIDTTLNFDGLSPDGSGSIDISYLDDLITEF